MPRKRYERLHKCCFCDVMVRPESTYCRACRHRWGRYLDLPDRGHGLGDALTDDDCLAILMAMAKQGRAKAEGVGWL